MKINYKNARERINELVKGYDVYLQGNDTYIRMTEAEYDAIREHIIEHSTKLFAVQVARYSKKYNIAWIGHAYGGRLATYSHHYCTIKFI